MSLGEAIERASALYKREGRAKVDATSAVAAWGYSSLNGASLRVLSALRQYGLLEGSNEDIRLSEHALTLLLEPQTSVDYATALRAAVTAPTLYQAILAEYPDGLPSDAAMVSYLVRKQGLGEAAAKSVLDSFRQSIELVESRGASYIVTEDVTNVSPPQRSLEQAKPMHPNALAQQIGNVSFTTTLTLSPNSSLELRITGAFPTDGELEYLPQFLDLARLQLLKAVAKATADAGASTVVS
jgi:hypothetical protein